MSDVPSQDRPQLSDFSTMLPGLMQDPYPFYATLRGAPPVFWAPKEAAWVLHRQEEIQQVLTDRGVLVSDLAGSVQAICQRSAKPAPMLTGLLAAFLPFVNPPEHDLSRRYIRAVLSAEAMQGAAPAIEGFARDLLAQAPPDGRFDAATSYAEMLPALVMGWFLNLPGSMVLDFMHATAEMGRFFDRGCSPRFLARMEEQIAASRKPIQSEVAARRRAGTSDRTDGLSRMISLADELRPMSDVAIADHAMAMIIAATENTSALIGNAIAAFVEAGPDCGLSTADDATSAAAVLETLRFDPPLQQLWRVADRAFDLGGARIATGDRLLLLVGAAQRDPARYPEPDRFDPSRFAADRPSQTGLGLGRGRHYCLGGDLGLLEAAIAFKLIARRNPRSDPNAPFVRENRQTLRKLQHLPLILAPERDQST